MTAKITEGHHGRVPSHTVAFVQVVMRCNVVDIACRLLPAECVHLQSMLQMPPAVDEQQYHMQTC